MYVITIIDTQGMSNGKEWRSRTAVCIDEFHGTDGGGEYVKCFKVTADCPVPLPDDNVEPLFNKYGKCASWDYPDGYGYKNDC